MKINEVANLLNLSCKSIRYYEEEGLLKPNRNANNYRRYDETDIKRLKLIKFLRELNVSIYDLKKIFNDELSLKECLKNQLWKINNQEKSYELIKNICEEIINNNQNYQDIDITEYEKTLNVLKKEGFTLKEISKNHHYQILGVILSSLIFEILIVFLFVVFVFNLKANLYLILIILLFPSFGLVVNLIKRIKEIMGGEEDEASKY